MADSQECGIQTEVKLKQEVKEESVEDTVSLDQREITHEDDDCLIAGAAMMKWGE